MPLLVYKYASFALGVAESALGLSLPDVFASLIAPLGISFFTMQAIGYVVDVYKGRCDAITNVGEYGSFAAFFPTIVSGPIQRTSLLPQQLQRMLSDKSFISYEQVVSGAITALWGLFLKMVIADRVALFVNTVYDAWWLYESVELVLGTFGYALQVFCDFAGYSCIAIGAARMMGIDAATFPGQLCQASTWNPFLLYEMGTAIAEEAVQRLLIETHRRHQRRRRRAPQAHRRPPAAKSPAFRHSHSRSRRASWHVAPARRCRATNTRSNPAAKRGRSRRNASRINRLARLRSTARRSVRFAVTTPRHVLPSPFGAQRIAIDPHATDRPEAKTASYRPPGRR